MSRQSPGRVRDAIISFLQITPTATVPEIFESVKSTLGEDVSPSSVRSYLGLNADRAFERLDRGVYRLRAAEEKSLFDFAEAPEVQQIGAALLVEGDCFSWLRERERNSIEAIVTDPPYGLVEYSEQEQRKLRDGKGGVWRIPPSFDGHRRSPLPRFTTLKENDLQALEQFFSRWGRAVMPILVPGANIIVASQPLVSHVVSQALVAAGLEKRGEIVRLVMTMRGGDRPKNAHEEFRNVSVMPRSMWEPWLVFRKPIAGRVQDNLRKWKTGGFGRISDSRPFGDVIKSHPTKPSERRLAPHPSLKPQSFLRQVVRAALPLGEGTVLDPFAGSGSTLAAAIAVGYHSIGIELDKQYAETARKAIIPLSKLAAN